MSGDGRLVLTGHKKGRAEALVTVIEEITVMFRRKVGKDWAIRENLKGWQGLRTVIEIPVESGAWEGTWR